MKKRFLLILLIGSLLIFTGSCKLFEYIAHVVICNVGDFAVLAAVDDSEDIIRARTSETWEIVLDNADPVNLELYAELINDPTENTTEIISLADGEVYSWDIGWIVSPGNAAKLKKIKK